MKRHVRLFTIPNKRDISYFARSKGASEYNNNKASYYICTEICINFKVVSFANNFREVANLKAVYEKILKLHISAELNKKLGIFVQKELICIWEIFYLN